MEIITGYLNAFLKFVLNGKESALLERQSDDFPEVKIVRSNRV